MQHYIIRLFLLIIFSVVSIIGIQAKTTFTVQAPPRVEVGNKFHVIYRVRTSDGNISSEPKVSQINGCTLIYGPIASGHSTMVEIINGVTNSSTEAVFTCTYKADKIGEYTITPASITVEGKRYTTKPATINIVEATNPQNNSSNTPNPVSIYDIDTHSSDRNVSANDVFVRIMLSKSSAYEKEAIECNIKLYTKYEIQEFRPTTQPAFDGFVVEEVPFQSSLNAVERVGNQDYMTALLKKCILFPQKSGKLTINSGVYDLTVIQYESINQGFYVQRIRMPKKIKINSNSASINITPLPQPQPTGFNGAVGKFDVSTKLTTTSFRTNEPATLTYKITGTGNIKFINDPELDFPSEFEQYAPQNNTDAKIAGSNVSGTTTIDYTFIPQEVGNYTIGVPAFVYFNPTDGEYHTIELPTYEIKVQKGVSVATTQQDVSAKNTDILFIKKGVGDLSHEHDYIITSGWYWSLYVVLLIVIAATIAYATVNRKQMSDVKKLRLAKANKVARKRLKLANQFMQKHDSEQFYAELLKAMWGYISDKLSIPSSQLLRQNISEQLTERGAEQQLCDNIIEVLDECEMARYTPSGSQEKMGTIYNKATNAINELENVKLIKK